MKPRETPARVTRFRRILWFIWTTASIVPVCRLSLHFMSGLSDVPCHRNTRRGHKVGATGTNDWGGGRIDSKWSGGEQCRRGEAEGLHHTSTR